MGARPLGRIIQEHIKKPLADEVLFGKLKKGGTVRVSVETRADGTTGLKLELIADTVPAKPKKETPSKPAAKKKRAPRKPKEKPVEAVAGDGSKDNRRRSPTTVPKVPRKD